MKIVFASKYYYRRGGLEAYLFRAKKLMESKGHQVIPFSTNYEHNFSSEYSKYFCSYYDLSKKTGLIPIVKSLRATSKMFFNVEAYRNIKKLISDTKPDICQGFGVTKHLSYSIFRAAKEMGIPTVMRLSDYALICPKSTAVDGFENLCSNFSCCSGNLTKIIRKKCIHGSYIASLLGAFEVQFNLFFKTYQEYIDYFIAPSQFIRDTFIKYYNIPPKRIKYIPIFSEPSFIPADTDEGFFLFAGRLSDEKGVFTLLKAISKDKRLKLVIAGTGPEETNYRRYAEENNLNVFFLGFLEYKELKEVLVRCRALIIPSEWYENSPNIILEAYCQGKPVIGTRIGGIPELIEDGKTGYLFKCGDIDELSEKMISFHDNKDIAVMMGKFAFSKTVDKYNSDKHYDSLMKFYNSILKKKVLLVNNFYYNRGGDTTYLLSLKSLLERKGHDTIIFSMKHPKNIPSRWSKYFVKYINFEEEIKAINMLSGIRVFIRAIYFNQSRRLIKTLILDERPNIAHIHNIHNHISPSILGVLRKYMIPVVWTLHDYQMICPNISFIDHGKICEKCLNNKYFSPFLAKCKKDSYLASLLSSVEIFTHNIIMKIDKMVNVYIAPSDFSRNKHIEYGFIPEKIITVSNFIDVDKCINSDLHYDEGYILYVGRISEEKGIRTLIDAVIKLNSCKLKIVGDGPSYNELIEYIELQNKNMLVEFLGHKDHAEVSELLKKCTFVVVPSEWFEVFGLVVLEAFSYGKPVIASMIGGMPEIVFDNENGLTFEARNVDDLSMKIEYLLNNPEETRRMGLNALKSFELINDSDEHYRRIMEIYNQASCSLISNY